MYLNHQLGSYDWSYNVYLRGGHMCAQFQEGECMVPQMNLFSEDPPMKHKVETAKYGLRQAPPSARPGECGSLFMKIL